MAETLVQNLIEFIPKVRGQGFQQLNKGIMTSHKSLFSLRNMFGAFFGYDLYTSFRNLIPSLVDASQKMGAMESRFRAVSKTAQAGADELNWVASQSRRLGLDFLNTADNYSIFFATLKNSMGQGQTREMFREWSEAFRVLHVPKEQQSRVLYALREMSSKGKIYMQDLALQLGNAVPDAMGLAAKSMGYTGKNATNEFRQAIKDGEIDVKKFLVTFSRMVNKTYVDAGKLAEAMNKPDAQLQTMAANWQLFQIALAKSGFEKDLVSFLKNINKLLPILEKHAHGIYKTLKLLGGALILLIGAKTLFSIIQIVLQVNNLTKALVGLRASIAMMQFMTGATVGSGIMAGLLGFLLNPYVLGAVLIAGLIAALAFVVKKFFPNVWVKVMHYFFMFKRFMWNLLNDIDNHPAVMALKKWFGTEKKGLSKDIKDKQDAWAKKVPFESVAKTGGFFDALNMWVYNKAMSLTPQTKGARFAIQNAPAIGSAITKYIVEQKYKIDVKVDGVEDKATILDSVKSAISEFAEKNKKQSAIDIVNSKIFGPRPFSPGY